VQVATAQNLLPPPAFIAGGAEGKPLAAFHGVDLDVHYGNCYKRDQAASEPCAAILMLRAYISDAFHEFFSRLIGWNAIVDSLSSIQRFRLVTQWLEVRQLLNGGLQIW